MRVETVRAAAGVYVAFAAAWFSPQGARAASVPLDLYMSDLTMHWMSSGAAFGENGTGELQLSVGTPTLKSTPKLVIEKDGAVEAALTNFSVSGSMAFTDGVFDSSSLTISTGSPGSVGAGSYTFQMDAAAAPGINSFRGSYLLGDTTSSGKFTSSTFGGVDVSPWESPVSGSLNVMSYNGSALDSDAGLNVQALSAVPSPQPAIAGAVLLAVCGGFYAARRLQLSAN